MPSTFDLEGLETNEMGVDEYLSVISPMLKSEVEKNRKNEKNFRRLLDPPSASSPYLYIKREGVHLMEGKIKECIFIERRSKDIPFDKECTF